MEKSSQAKIISWNMNHGEICASAARISTTKGNAAEILEKAKENEKMGNWFKRFWRQGINL